MRSRSMPITILLAPLAANGCMSDPHAASASWLDSPKPDSWNTPGEQVPLAPKHERPADARCHDLARPPQLREDEAVRERGWDLVGEFRGGWGVIVVQGATAYDGMCRPLQYQSFVFVDGEFAGTLSPEPMDSRTDGALGQITLHSGTQLTAEYSRYEESDPLCCPSRRTVVTFEIATDPVTVRPASATTEPSARNSD